MTEKELMKQVEEASSKAMMEIGGEAISPEIRAEILGTLMAVLDALLAIRDGKEWRGMTDPKAIAAEILRKAGFTGDTSDE